MGKASRRKREARMEKEQRMPLPFTEVSDGPDETGRISYRVGVSNGVYDMPLLYTYCEEEADEFYNMLLRLTACVGCKTIHYMSDGIQGRECESVGKCSVIGRKVNKDGDCPDCPESY